MIKKYLLGGITFPQLGQGLYDSTKLNLVPYVDLSYKAISNLPSVAGKSTTPNSSSQAISSGINNIGKIISQLFTGNLFDSDSELGNTLGLLFSRGSEAAIDTISNNIIKGQALTEGLSKNIGTSVAGAGAGIAANYIGQGITSLMGNSKVGKFTGLAAATGLGTVGGRAAANLVQTGKVGKLFGSGAINPAGLGMSMIGTGLSAALGPSKEYGGRYGNITKGLDTAYDIVSVGVNAVPGIGQAISGAMALNKGLSNLFGSTDGMTKTDAILGSAFMPAPVKWLNMWGSSKTGTFDRQSWQNRELTTSFMLNGYGNLQEKFDKALEEAGKRYGTFSQGAKRRALKNIDFSNRAYLNILDMAYQNRYLNIRAEDMSSINNQRYALMILGGWTPTAIGKQGMKILNNATNHNIGLRLLSGAALIDNKQMILSI